MDYKKAGVDIEAGYKSVELMKEHVKKTMREEVLGGLGGFSGAFSLAKIKDMEEPVLLSGTDGCGTKVKLAMIMDKHDTIGIDAVAMCVNDIACAGGEPLFFLDYIACGKNYPEKIADIVKGVAEGCLQSEAALIGGETAEHPGLMAEDEYDLAGFSVGVCDKKDMITGENLQPGDVLIGMASTGVHSNGFSLVRRVFEKEMTAEGLNTYYDELGKTLGETLLAPTRIYVNDIACAGGEPLFFLDYIACGKNYPEKIADIVKGVAEGCLQSEAALIGGETAEHPGLMAEDEYDLAGFSVGVCDKKDMITGENLQPGDVLIGMASTGVHSNGFSLVRRVFEKEMTAEGLNTYYDELGKTLGETLLAPTRIYVKALKNVKKAGVTVKACSHITGGGFYENVPRMLKDGVRAVIHKDSYQIPPIFPLMQKKGEIDEKIMYNTFNMGIGMVVAVAEEDVRTTMAAMKAAGDIPYIIGSIEAGEKGVTLC